MKSAIILSYHKSNRYKDLYPKCLIEINGQTLLEKQIDFLRQNGCTDINIIGGYKIDSLKDNKDINVIYCQGYETFSEVQILDFALDKIYYSSELFLIFGNVHIEASKINSDSSYVLTNEHKNGIGCFSYDDKIIRMSFDAKEKWGKVLYLNTQALDILKNEDKKNHYFIFELINLIIDNKCKVQGIRHNICNIDTKRDIMNAENILPDATN